MYISVDHSDKRIQIQLIDVGRNQDLYTCQSSSVTNGMNGWSNFSMFSKTYKRTACATEAAESPPDWYRRALLASIYLTRKEKAWADEGRNTVTIEAMYEDHH